MKLELDVYKELAMSNDSFDDGVREQAFYNYLNRINNNLPENSFQDWLDAEREQKIYEKIKEEAYYHYLNYGDYSLMNWLIAKNEINQRLQFLAFYLHESNINKSPIDNWVEAQNLYIEKF
jgi:phosphoribosyl-ATP pyrophosphohydrolase